MKDIHNSENKFLVYYQNNVADNKGLSAKNRQIIDDFLTYVGAEGLSASRKYKFLVVLKKALSILGNKDLIDISTRDLTTYASKIKSNGYTWQTQHTMLIVMKKFYKTLTTEDKYKSLEPIYQWLYDKRDKYFKIDSKQKKEVTKEEWFTEEDLKKIIAGAKTLRDKAFFSISSTQGTRPEEILTIKAVDVVKINKGIKVKISGKTGVRDLYIYEGFVIDNTLSYIATLPQEQEYLFEFSLKRINDILKEICEAAGIKKRAYLYKLRKFAVTRDRILGLSSGALEQKYGWVKGTKSIATYDKSISLDYQKEMQQRYGIVKDTEPRSTLIDWVCLRCGESNAYSKEYCGRCATRKGTTAETLALIENKEKMAARIADLETGFKKLADWIEAREKVPIEKVF